jgi:hypothetical protein
MPKGMRDKMGTIEILLYRIDMVSHIGGYQLLSLHLYQKVDNNEDECQIQKVDDSPKFFVSSDTISTIISIRHFNSPSMQY